MVQSKAEIPQESWISLKLPMKVSNTYRLNSTTHMQKAEFSVENMSELSVENNNKYKIRIWEVKRAMFIFCELAPSLLNASYSLHLLNNNHPR